MEDQANQNQSQGPPPPQPPPLPAPESEPPVEEEEEDEEDDSKKEEEELVAKVNRLMEKIISAPDNPKPAVLHALASILETQESRYMEENGYSSSSNARAAHNIGRLGSLIRENDEFFELISSKFLAESTYSTAVQAATCRLLLCCSLTWIYPHVLTNLYWTASKSGC